MYTHTTQLISAVCIVVLWLKIMHALTVDISCMHCWAVAEIHIHNTVDISCLASLCCGWNTRIHNTVDISCLHHCAVAEIHVYTTLSTSAVLHRCAVAEIHVYTTLSTSAVLHRCAVGEIHVYTTLSTSAVCIIVRWLKYMYTQHSRHQLSASLCCGWNTRIHNTVDISCLASLCCGSGWNTRIHNSRHQLSAPLCSGWDTRIHNTVDISCLHHCQTIFTAHLMGITWTVSEIIEHLFFSWLRSMWPGMKVKVNIMNTRCILMSEAVIVPSFILMTSIVSEICLQGTETQTDTASSM